MSKGEIIRVFQVALASALAFILCGLLGMAINPQSWHKFVEVPSELPVLTGRSRSYYWDIALYGELTLKNTCSAFYPLWSWLIRGLWHPQTIIQASRGFLVTATVLFGLSLPLVVWVFQASLGRRDVAVGMALLYSLSPMAIFRVNGYSEGLFGVLSVLWLGLLLPLQRLPQPNGARSPMNGWRWGAVGLVTGLMALARPVLVQTVAAAIATLTTLLVWGFCQSPSASVRTFLPWLSQSQPRYRQPIQATVWLSCCAGLGYSIYGGLCWITRGSFFAPFQDQSLWKKSLGIRLDLLLFPKSPLIDLWALYLPVLLLIVGGLLTYNQIVGNQIAGDQIAGDQITGKRWAGWIPRSPLWFLLCIYPPALVLAYGGRSLLRRFRSAPPSCGAPQAELPTSQHESDALGQSALGQNYLFWFSVYFALSHSAIAFFTQDRLVSLGRYVFALPFIFLALGYIFRSLPPKKAVPIMYGLSGISVLYLINQWVDYGFHKWLG